MEQGITSTRPSGTAPVSANDEEAPHLELFYGQRQDLVGNLGAVLAANEPETFAGLWIEHKPQFKGVVLFTRDGGGRTSSTNLSPMRWKPYKLEPTEPIHS